MKVNYNNQRIELGERSGALAASTLFEAGRVRAAEGPAWCRHNITGGAVKYEKVLQQLQHSAGSAPRSRRVSRKRLAAAERETAAAQ